MFAGRVSPVTFAFAAVKSLTAASLMKIIKIGRFAELIIRLAAAGADKNTLKEAFQRFFDSVVGNPAAGADNHDVLAFT